MIWTNQVQGVGKDKTLGEGLDKSGSGKGGLDKSGSGKSGGDKDFNTGSSYTGGKETVDVGKGKMDQGGLPKGNVGGQGNPGSGGSGAGKDGNAKGNNSGGNDDDGKNSNQGNGGNGSNDVNKDGADKGALSAKQINEMANVDSKGKEIKDTSGNPNPDDNGDSSGPRKPGKTKGPKGGGAMETQREMASANPVVAPALMAIGDKKVPGALNRGEVAAVVIPVAAMAVAVTGVTGGMKGQTR